MSAPTPRAIVMLLALSLPARFVFAAAAKPDAAPPPAAPTMVPPPDRLTPDEIQKLQATIKGLYDRFEQQGHILAAISTDLAKIMEQANQGLPDKLDAVGASIVKDNMKRSDDVHATLAKLTDAVSANSEATAKLAANPALDDLRKRVADLQTKIEGDLVQLRSTLAAQHPASLALPSPAAGADVGPLAGLAICTVLLAAMIWWNGRTQRLALAAHLAAAVDRSREQVQATLQEALQSSSAERDRTLSGREQSVTENLTQLQRLIERFERLDRRADDLTTKGRSVVPADEKTTVPGPNQHGPAIPSDVLWPSPFLDPASPLARWRALLESHLTSPEHPALPVLAALLALRLLLESPSPATAEVAAAVATLSQVAHAYWQSFSDLNEDDRQRASADWIAGVKRLIAPVAPKVDLREIVPGARFDPDTMQTVEEGPGNHLNVAAVFSWAILDRTGERPKTLSRARIATT